MLVRTVIAVLLAVLVPQAAASCLAYWPSNVTISGKLERLTFPGRPNYESVLKGDEPEIGFYLKLSSPICTTGDRSDGTAYPVTNASFVQLILEQSGYASLRPLLGKRVILRGTLMAAHTGHHHAPVLLDDVSVLPGNGR